MGKKEGGKTRTAAAHGPLKDKKSYKASSDKPRSSKSAERTKDGQAKKEHSKPREEQPTSLLNAPEEIDFPRGGGTTLTAAEVREAELEGQREAEQEGANERKKRTDSSTDKSKKKRKRSERDDDPQTDEKRQLPKDAVRVEHLNYKRIVPTTRVLCQVVAIRPLELIVSLPNQLLGHVPITSISPAFTERLEDAGEDSDDSDSENDDDNPQLSQIFRVGQWLPAIVVSNTAHIEQKVSLREGEEIVRSSRRVELSIEPQKVNEHVAPADLQPGYTLVASVSSVEDKGYILSLGIGSITSFLPFKDVEKSSKDKLQLGQLVGCRVKKMNENGRTCTVSVNPTEVTGSLVQTASSITSVLPGTLVTALVTAVLSTGLNVKFLGYYTGTIDLFHLDGKDPESSFAIGQKLRARVIWDSIGSDPKKFSLSLNKLVLDEAQFKVGSQPAEEVYPVGRILESVKVVGVDHEWGLTCRIEDDDTPVRAFVHISHVSDEHLPTISKSGKWKIGTKHRGRVIGYSAFDGLIQLSLQPSVLEKAFLRVSDVKVGEIVKGTVKKLTDSALFVSVSGSVDAVVWPLHYSDIKLKHPERKFKPGQTVKGRIFAVDPAKNRLSLTLKKRLVETERPIITKIEDASIGMLTDGVVSKILEKSVLVDFFGGLRAIVPASEAAEEFTSDLSAVFTLGNAVTVRIMSVDKANNKIVASARRALPTYDEPEKPAMPAIEVGTVTKGEIAEMHESNIVLTLKPSGAKALISFAVLSRHRKQSVEDLKTNLQVGDEIGELIVVSKNVDKGIVIVGIVPSKKAVEKAPKERVSYATLKPGQKLTGKVAGRVPSGLLIQLAKGIRGRVNPTELSDDYDETIDEKAGREVQCCVLAVDPTEQRIDLSLRASRLSDIASKPRDPAISSVSDLKPGQAIRGFVKNVANQGLFVSLSSSVTARVQIKELFDEYVKDWKPRFSVGQLVEGKILAVDKVSSQVEMSLRKSATVKKVTKNLSDFEEGQVVDGIIKKVETYGAFIRIADSDVSGLCHKSKVSDDDEASWADHVRVGQSVKAVILSVDLEESKISLGLKKSLFPEGDLPADDESSEGDEDFIGGDAEDDESGDEDEDVDEGDEETDEDEDEDVTMSEAQTAGAMYDDDDVDSDIPSGSDGEMQRLIAHLQSQEDESNDEDDASDDEEEPAVASASAKHANGNGHASALKVAKPFTWDAEDSDDEASEDAESEREDAIEEPAAKKRKVEKANGSLNDGNGPTSVVDFERLVLGSPSSSYIWIQYIAYFVGLSQLDKAREVARRALRTINFREEAEKLNVWVALLNLENTYGDETSLENTFKEATQFNDSRTVHLQMIEILDKSGKYEQEEELFKRLVKKFSQVPDSWTRFGQFYLQRGRNDEARELLPRSLKSLDKPKHVETISKFAQLEFKFGDPERGRTIFEGVLDSYPKRLDLWFVYIDMEIRQKNVVAVRTLFERVLLRKLSSKKGKSVFKKWLSFEKEHGDAKGEEHCKERARAFVESLAASKTGDEGEGDDE